MSGTHTTYPPPMQQMFFTSLLRFRSGRVMAGAEANTSDYTLYLFRVNNVFSFFVVFDFREIVSPAYLRSMSRSRLESFRRRRRRVNADSPES